MRKKLLITGILLLIITLTAFFLRKQILIWSGCAELGLSLFFGFSKCKIMHSLPALEGIIFAIAIVLIVLGIDFDSLKKGGEQTAN